MSFKKISHNLRLSNMDINRGLTLPLILDSDLSYLCGILVGDGSIYYRKLKYDYIIKCVGNPCDEKELYNRIIGPKFKGLFGFLPKIKLQDSNTTFGFTIHSKTLFRYFTEIIGLVNGKKGSRLEIPPIILREKELVKPFLKGLFDTDGCISFKRKYKEKPYYPVITLSSKSKKLIFQVSCFLKQMGFKVVEIYGYKLNDSRMKNGFTIINRLELNGKDNLRLWVSKIGFSSPKHNYKIRKYLDER